ncbi:MAG: SMP-30/gluconolactonase/LRE family protein [Eudoraea sp.]
MKYLTNKLFLILVIVTALSCKTDTLKSTDFTKENLFTSGIEGPAVNIQGDLFAVNYGEEGTIGKVDANGNCELYITLPEGSIGNGIRFDLQGNMFIADYNDHKVYRVKEGTKTLEVWAQNDQMNQPNDLVVKDNGFIYLSDPNWSQDTGNLWMVTPKREVVLLEENMGTTNGIEISPDNKYLYVNESVQRIVWKYEFTEDGTLKNKTEFIRFDDHGLDGMRCDNKGNLYITRHGKGTVVIVSPNAEILNEITLSGKKPSNITFGGENGENCFVTIADRGCFETFKSLAPGNYYSKTH